MKDRYSLITEFLEDFPKNHYEDSYEGSSIFKIFFRAIRDTRTLVVAYIWRFILAISFLLYAHIYAYSRNETIAILIIDIINAQISINASLRMALELSDRAIHIILLIIVIILASCSFYIPILLLVLNQNQMDDRRIHLYIFIAVLIIDIIICSLALITRIHSKSRNKSIYSDNEPNKLVIKNYRTSITIIKPEKDLRKLKNAYAYYKASFYGAHLTISTYCLFTAKWCLLTISKIDLTVLYDIIPWSLLLPLCTFLTIFIGARILSNNAIVLDCIIHIFQIIYILHQLLCLPFPPIECNKLALSRTVQKGFEILSLQNFGLQILTFNYSDKSFEELKLHLEYVPADEFEYKDCRDMYGNSLEKDLEEHTKKRPFLMHIPYD
ncbi:21041_t:CDS:2 [Cetraspora pellucida]|uniref:21041_t:CDS:1 n=1 Tax=Cetraspora pellucida TaxID=1433469 RepID=A0A9N8YVW2_9GLOM|nr:21041_t:CDS:2 [Cetraspora pellucida]